MEEYLVKRQKIITRAKALAAMAADKSSTYEALIASQRLTKLIKKYNITYEELGFKNPNTSDTKSDKSSSSTHSNTSENNNSAGGTYKKKAEKENNSYNRTNGTDSTEKADKKLDDDEIDRKVNQLRYIQSIDLQIKEYESRQEVVQDVYSNRKNICDFLIKAVAVLLMLSIVITTSKIISMIFIFDGGFFVALLDTFSSKLLLYIIASLAIFYWLVSRYRDHLYKVFGVDYMRYQDLISKEQSVKEYYEELLGVKSD